MSTGFPSAQTTLALGLAFGLALVVPYRLRSVAVGAATLWAVAVGAYTVAAGQHRPGDVIAAALVVLAVFCGLLAVLARKGKVRPGARRGPALPGLPVTVPLALLAVGGLGAGLWFLGGTLALPATAPYDPAELRIAHRCGQALAAGVVAAMRPCSARSAAPRRPRRCRRPVPARRTLRGGRRSAPGQRARGPLHRGPRSRDILMSSNLAYADVERSTR